MTSSKGMVFCLELFVGPYDEEVGGAGASLSLDDVINVHEGCPKAEACRGTTQRVREDTGAG